MQMSTITAPRFMRRTSSRGRSLGVAAPAANTAPTTRSACERFALDRLAAWRSRAAAS
jgi:hypothetical protein